MSYADGALDAETSSRLEAALERDPALADRLRLFTGTRDVLADLRAARPAAPVSDELMARVRQTLDRANAPDNVTAFRPRPAATADRRPSGWKGAAIAASLALVAGLGTGFGIGRVAPDVAAGGGLAGPELADALSGLTSGESRSLAGGQLMVVSSFRTEGGEFCREFELAQEGGSTLTSVACRAGREWDLRFAVASGGGAEGYAPASALDSLEVYLTGIGAGAALSPEEEARLLAD